MIEIIPTLLTPAMLAMSAPAMPATEHTYDWQNQRTVMMVGGKHMEPVNYGSMNGSNSYVGGTLTVDDWRQDCPPHRGLITDRYQTGREASCLPSLLKPPCYSYFLTVRT